MPAIVLCTINARYIHASFGLRYLRANLGALRDSSEILEFTLQQDILLIAEQILTRAPKIVGIGVYIWNRDPVRELVAILRRVQPDLHVIVGGPEVSHGQDALGATHVITGEADLRFAEVCADLLADREVASIVHARAPAFSEIVLPYGEYSSEDVANRVIYVEASRGCPFACEFCLSSLPGAVRRAPLRGFFAALEDLLARGVTSFKFVDRTFNLDLQTAESILDFFYERRFDGLFLHFEMIPDRFPESLRERVSRFPAGMMQFEVGIQTFNPEVAKRLRRRNSPDRIEANLRYLREHTGAHLHVDLIMGLPGESLESFANGFDRLYRLQPHEIQLGLLKYLKGTPLSRHDEAFDMIYRDSPPYDLLRNRDLSFSQLVSLRHVARLWERMVNRDRFPNTVPLLLSGSSPFKSFYDFSTWLISHTGQSHGLGLERVTKLVFQYLTEQAGVSIRDAAVALAADHHLMNRYHLPRFLAVHLPA